MLTRKVFQVIVLLAVILFAGCTSRTTLKLPKNKVNPNIINIDTTIEAYNFFKCRKKHINIDQRKKDKKYFQIYLSGECPNSPSLNIEVNIRDNKTIDIASSSTVFAVINYAGVMERREITKVFENYKRKANFLVMDKLPYIYASVKQNNENNEKVDFTFVMLTDNNWGDFEQFLTQVPDKEYVFNQYIKRQQIIKLPKNKLLQKILFDYFVNADDLEEVKQFVYDKNFQKKILKKHSVFDVVDRYFPKNIAKKLKSDIVDLNNFTSWEEYDNEKNKITHIFNMTNNLKSTKNKIAHYTFTALHGSNQEKKVAMKQLNKLLDEYSTNFKLMIKNKVFLKYKNYFLKTKKIELAFVDMFQLFDGYPTIMDYIDEYNDFYFNLAKKKLVENENDTKWEELENYQFKGAFDSYTNEQKQDLDLLKRTAKSKKQKEEYAFLNNLYAKKRKQLKHHIAYLRKANKDKEVAHRNYIKKLKSKYSSSVIIETSNRIFIFPNKSTCEKYGGQWFEHNGKKVCKIRKDAYENDSYVWYRGQGICEGMDMRLPKNSEMKRLFYKLELYVEKNFWSSGTQRNHDTPWFMIDPEWMFNEYPTTNEYGNQNSWDVKHGSKNTNYTQLKAVVCTNK